MTDVFMMESVADTILSVPVRPSATYPARLTKAACKAVPNASEQDIWKGAQTDQELLHRINMIHRFLCTDLKLGELTGIVDQWLAAQEKGRDHV